MKYPLSFYDHKVNRRFFLKTLLIKKLFGDEIKVARDNFQSFIRSKMINGPLMETFHKVAYKSHSLFFDSISEDASVRLRYAEQPSHMIYKIFSIISNYMESFCSKSIKQ